MKRIFASLLALLSFVIVKGQNYVNDIPKLIIGISIDQLRGDYLEQFKNSFSNGGFARLQNEGVVYAGIDFNNNNFSNVSSVTTVLTGQLPKAHGITNSEIYNIEKQEKQHIFNDKSFIGNYTQNTFSPLALKYSTIGDELKHASKGKSKVYSFAGNPDIALSTASKFGDAAYWIDNLTGKWATSTYYKYLSAIIDKKNKETDYIGIVTNNVWYAEKNTTSTSLPYSDNKTPFRHSLKDRKNAVEQSKKTPFSNKHIINTVEQLINKTYIGRGEYPDFLSINLYAGLYPEAPEYGGEIEDLYIKLDLELENLLNVIDSQIGKNNCLVFVYTTGYYDGKTPATSSYENAEELTPNIFKADVAKTLLNMYLMALYGNSQNLVIDFFNNQYFLNRKIIEEKKLNLTEIRELAAEFLSQLSGVKQAYSIDKLDSNYASKEQEILNNSYLKETSGDIIIQLKPYWVNSYDDNVETFTSYCVNSPVFFWGNNLKPKEVNRIIDAVDISPTLAHILRIRPPNSLSKSQLIEITK